MLTTHVSGNRPMEDREEQGGAGEHCQRDVTKSRGDEPIFFMAS